jgi:hypothetical protein
MSPSADGAQRVRRASYERGSMLDVTVAGSCAASCLRSALWVQGLGFRVSAQSHGSSAALTRCCLSACMLFPAV